MTDLSDAERDRVMAALVIVRRLCRTDPTTPALESLAVREAFVELARVLCRHGVPHSDVERDALEGKDAVIVVGPDGAEVGRVKVNDTTLQRLALSMNTVAVPQQVLAALLTAAEAHFRNLAELAALQSKYDADDSDVEDLRNVLDIGKALLEASKRLERPG
jgi:hypothetical protein